MLIEFSTFQKHSADSKFTEYMYVLHHENVKTTIYIKETMFPYLPRKSIFIFMSSVNLKDSIPSSLCFTFLFINFCQNTLYPPIIPLGSLGSNHVTSKDFSRFEFGQVTLIASPGTRMFEELAIYQY